MANRSNWITRVMPVVACSWVLAIVPNLKQVHAEDDHDSRISAEFHAPVRLEADGKPIDISEFSSIAHAGPTIADVDGDGDQDLLVGDFPGHFWYFQNEGDDDRPVYTSQGKLKAGSVDAKTPVY